MRIVWDIIRFLFGVLFSLLTPTTVAMASAAMFAYAAFKWTMVCQTAPITPKLMRLDDTVFIEMQRHAEICAGSAAELALLGSLLAIFSPLLQLVSKRHY